MHGRLHGLQTKIETSKLPFNVTHHNCVTYELFLFEINHSIKLSEKKDFHVKYEYIGKK